MRLPTVLRQGQNFKIGGVGKGMSMKTGLIGLRMITPT